MINANNAHRKSIVNSTAKTHMTNIEKVIMRAVENGAFTTEYTHDITPVKDGEEVLNAIKAELVANGYKVTATYHDPSKCNPRDCGFDDNGKITLSW